MVSVLRVPRCHTCHRAPCAPVPPALPDHASMATCRMVMPGPLEAFGHGEQAAGFARGAGVYFLCGDGGATPRFSAWGDRGRPPLRKDVMATFPRLCKALEHLVDRWGPVEGRTRLMKLIYLADLEWARRTALRTPRRNTTAGTTDPSPARCSSPWSGWTASRWLQTTQLWDGGDTYCYRSGARTRLAAVELDSAFVEVLDRVGDQWSGRP